MKNRSRSCSPSRPNSSGNSRASSRSGSPENSQTEHTSKSVSKESERVISSDEEAPSVEKNKTTGEFWCIVCILWYLGLLPGRIATLKD